MQAMSPVANPSALCLRMLLEKKCNPISERLFQLQEVPPIPPPAASNVSLDVPQIDATDPPSPVQS